MTRAQDLDPTGRFSNRAEDYVRYRPAYPPAAIDFVLAGLAGLDGVARASGIRAVDVGAGTGISTRLLAERGLNVIAVEPNRAMREAAEPHPCVTWQDGTAERLGLPRACAELVLCAQAFHWFRAEESVREMARVLVPGGRLVLMWNHRSLSEPLMLGYEAAILAAATDPRVLSMASDVEAVERSGRFGPTRVERFRHDQALSEDALLGRALSASYVPKTGPAHDELVLALRALFAQHQDGGHVRFVYETEVRISERLPD